MVLELTWCLQFHTNSWTLGLRWGTITSRNSFLGEETRTISCIHATLVQAFHLSTPFILYCKTELEATMAMFNNGVSRMRGSTLLQRVTSRVTEAPKCRWGLPVLVPTCPKKMFIQGPRLKCIDIVTDTLHASSSDLITWNTLVMMKLRWINEIPRE